MANSISIWQPVSSDQDVSFVYSESGFSSADVSVVDLFASDQDYDFVSFLALAQKLRIEFLPITWQPALQGIGLGATAEIRQSLINLQMSFAFKRITPRNYLVSDETDLMRKLFAEILVLGHPSIYGHPNVMRLEGVCWDVSEEDEKVWPVLVFEKSQYGDLEWFVNSGQGKTVPLEQRLKLCAAIVNAIMEMHSNGIIHGDIKPENVLVFTDDSGGYTARVTDFGYSTVFANETDLVSMPKSWPWSAPEHHHRGFKPAAAVKIDIFSLGLLCFWLVFKEHLSGDTSTTLNDLGGYVSSTICGNSCKEHQKQNLNKLKLENELITFACRYTKILDVDENRKSDLRLFFSSTLAEDPDQRDRDLKHLSSFLGIDRVIPPYQIDIMVAECHDSHTDFQVLPLMKHLIQVDYRVRRYIVTCLVHRTSNSEKLRSTKKISSSLAFQLAICYRLGFGIPLDVQASQAFLAQSSRDCEDLQRAIDLARKNSQTQFSPHCKFKILSDMGHILSDHAQYYRENQQLHRAEVQYKREIADMASVLGHESDIVLQLKSRLAIIYCNEGSFNESRKLQSQCVTFSSSNFGPEHPQTLSQMSSLAKVYWQQGQWRKAEELEIQIVESRKRVLGHGHTTTLGSMANLASTYLSQGRWQEAECLNSQVLALRRQTLGHEHPETLSSLSNLASGYKDQGRFEDAQQLWVQVMDMNQRVLGPNHGLTLLSMSNLSSTYTSLGQWQKAEELDIYVLKTRKRVLGQKHPDTLVSMLNLASVYQSQGRWKEAVDLQLQHLNAATLGPEHPTTLIGISNLAFMYWNQGRWKEAEDLGVQVVGKKEKVFGHSHPETLTTMNNLALTYQSQNRFQEAEGLQLKILRVSQLDQHHPLMLSVMNNLTITYRRLGRWEEAERLNVEVLERNKAIRGPEHPDTLISMANMATQYHNQEGREKDAEELYSQVLATEKKVLGLEHPDTLHSMHNLAEAWRKQGRYQEAEKLHRQALTLFEKVLGEEHPTTLFSKRNLAAMLSTQSVAK